MSKQPKYLKNNKGEFIGSIPSSKKSSSPLKIKNSEKPSTNSEKQNFPPYNSMYKLYKKTNIPPLPHTNQQEQPEEIVEIVEYINNELDQIEFLNHGDAANKEEWSNLEILSTNPKIAKNNCFAVTSSISQHIYEKIGLSENWSNTEIELYFEHHKLKKNNGVHWANVLENSQTREKWVLDYTARQFDDSAPYPLISRYSTWKKWVSSNIKNNYNQDLVSEKIF